MIRGVRKPRFDCIWKVWNVLLEICWLDRVRNEVLYRIKVAWKMLHAVKRRKDNWISHTLFRNCIMKHVIEGNMEGRMEMTRGL